MDIKPLLSKYNITPNKALGQNFLIDDNAVSFITDMALSDYNRILEIGAGLGALTHRLNHHAEQTLVIEIDKAMVDILESLNWENKSSISIIHSDFLKVSYEMISEYLGDTFSVAANLPYYITTPIIQRLLLCPYRIVGMTLMMQKEASEHFLAKAGTKLYSPATVLSDYLYDKKKVLDISPSSYYPQPEVDSVVLHFTEKAADRSLVPLLHSVVSAAFSMRRKTLVNNLCSLSIDKSRTREILSSMGISESARAEQLSYQDFVRLTIIVRNK